MAKNKKPRENAGLFHGGSHPDTSWESATSENSQGIPSYSLGGHIADALFNSGDAEPFQYPALRRRSPSWRAQHYAEGSALAEVLGRSGTASRLGNRAAGIYARHPGLDPGEPTTFRNPDGSLDWSHLSTSSQEGQGGLLREQKERFQRWAQNNPDADFDLGAAMNRARLNLSAGVERTMKEGLIDEIDPSLRKAQDAADANLDTAAIDAGTEAAIRSRFVAGAKQDSSTRLARISAGLGLGGTANSPAAAALAAQDAQFMDSQVVSGLRDLSVQTGQINRDQHSRDIELATRIASARFNLLNGDSKSIIGMQGDVTSMIDALYSRDQTMKLNQQALNASGQGAGGAGIAAGAVQGATAGAALGPWGAAGGAIIGGGMAYLGAR